MCLASSVGHTLLRALNVGAQSIVGSSSRNFDIDVLVIFSQIAGMLSCMKSNFSVVYQKFSDLLAIWFTANHRH
ncbi:hypothetical protein ASV53_24290 [Photobacterium sanguinicancri]|uniref:Uncharacterized protein n=1 Tax=Photobacterium sanguinicancri TaxID=875932 RepID=A0ABX4FQU8_9GAMM|nr:hypothetical protein ASV53_24290 [Photobacterium sanguinicancri]